MTISQNKQCLSLHQPDLFLGENIYDILLPASWQSWCKIALKISPHLKVWTPNNNGKKQLSYHQGATDAPMEAAPRKGLCVLPCTFLLVSSVHLYPWKNIALPRGREIKDKKIKRALIERGKEREGWWYKWEGQGIQSDMLYLMWSLRAINVWGLNVWGLNVCQEKYDLVTLYSWFCVCYLLWTKYLCPSQNSYVETLNLSVTAFGGWVFGR